MTKPELHKLCSKLGSDLNVCLEGGCVLATGRGENVKHLPFREYPVSLIKPNIGISAKEGYQMYSELKNKPHTNSTEKMIECLYKNNNIQELLHNDLEMAVFSSYKEFQKIKNSNPKSIMSGSGSTYFVLSDKITPVEDFWIKTGLKTISTGCEIIY